MGEVLDRLSILQLKIDAGMQRGIATGAWEAEQRELDSYLKKKIVGWQKRATAQGQADFGSMNGRLGLVNKKLWDAEDDIRRYRLPTLTDEQVREVCQLALRIADLNDVRCELVRQINLFFGVETREKIYVRQEGAHV
jgi:hypothetical protein